MFSVHSNKTNYLEILMILAMNGYGMNSAIEFTALDQDMVPKDKSMQLKIFTVYSTMLTNSDSPHMNICSWTTK
jgi:hypothetical protein